MNQVKLTKGRHQTSEILGATRADTSQKRGRREEAKVKYILTIGKEPRWKQKWNIIKNKVFVFVNYPEEGREIYRMMQKWNIG